MRVVVDTNVCRAHGDCVVTLPEVFDLGDDDDVVRLLEPQPREELRDKVQEAVDNCPTQAIRIED